jgi:hypothetical protein
MSDAPNFQSILDEAPSEVDRPKPLPTGTYLTTVQGPVVYDKSSRKQTPYVQFTLRVIGAMDDVDAEELNEMGGFEGKTIRATFYTTEDAIYRLDEFHEHCGIDLTDGHSRRTRNDEVINSHVLASIRHRTSDDGTQIFAELGRTAPAE